MNKISIEIGRRLRNYRTQQKLSQEELAERCGLHPTYIGQIERGEKNATIESISKIASGLKIPLSTLFENIEDYSSDAPNYAASAYSIVNSASPNMQKKLITILETIVDL